MTVRVLILVAFAIGMVFTPYIKNESNKLLKKPVQVENKTEQVDIEKIKTA